LRYSSPAVGSSERSAADAGTILTARTLGLAYLEENRLEDAQAEFTKLIRLAPDEPSGHANLGLVYLRLGRYQDACASDRPRGGRSPPMTPTSGCCKPLCCG